MSPSLKHRVARQWEQVWFVALFWLYMRWYLLRHPEESAEGELRFSLGGLLVAGFYLALWLVIVAAIFALL